MFESLHHISYTVSDLDQTIPFYREVLGFNFIHDVERSDLPAYDILMGHSNIRVRIAAFSIPGSPVTLELMQFRNPAPVERPQDFIYVGTPHIAYLVSDLDGEYQRIRAMGGRFISEVAAIERDGRYIGKAVFLLDPDGILIEPMELAKD